jgi:hypothetical protein
MIPLEPCGRLVRLLPGLDKVVNAFAENSVAKKARDPITRCRLKDYPGIVCEFPQFRIKLLPYSVSGMIPRRAHIERQLSQRIDSINFCG